MTIKKSAVASCCGRKKWIFQTESFVMRDHVEALRKHGFNAPTHMANAGMFFVEKRGLVASCPMGSNKIQIQCTLADCNQVMHEFETLIDKLTVKQNEGNKG
ncbi:MAG: hypothetical protein HC877_22340 [Thioploca sp.]|nr:hypothetical protein [Thioploca sp.]